MEYKCIKGFSLEKCDDDGFTIPGEYYVVEEGQLWIMPEDESYRFIGGEIRLENEDGAWLEIDKETLEEHFKEINTELKFYEFNKTEYYALIAAKNIDAAMDEYKEYVSCEFLGDEQERPVEITPEDAKKKLHEAKKYEYGERYTEELIDGLFNTYIIKNRTDLVLVDSNLL